MDKSYIEENKKARERLQKTVSKLTVKELTLPVNKEGWTVAAALAHIAFWDQRRLILLPKWKKDGFKPSPVDTDTINDTLVPFFLAIAPKQAAILALSTAEKLDGEIEGLPEKLVEDIVKSGDPHALNRAIHRNVHLDEIEKQLKSNSGK